MVERWKGPRNRTSVPGTFVLRFYTVRQRNCGAIPSLRFLIDSLAGRPHGQHPVRPPAHWSQGGIQRERQEKNGDEGTAEGCSSRESLDRPQKQLRLARPALCHPKRREGPFPPGRRGGGTNVSESTLQGLRMSGWHRRPGTAALCLSPSYMFVREGRLEAAVTGVAETIAAVNRPVPAGAEGDHGIDAALGADDGVHFPGSTFVPARALLGAASRAA